MLAGGLSFLATTRAADPAVDFTATQRPTEWIIRLHGRPVMVYSFAPEKFKPYVKALHTTRGENVLRDSPSDHLHHHALMYGIRVNGVNFWEETPGCGVEKPIQTEAPVMGVSASGLPQAVVKQRLHWVAPEDAYQPDTTKGALLVEERTLTLTIDEPAGEVALAWRSAFTVGAKTNQVVLTGANYHGLGMRFPAELDPLATHQLAGGRPDLSNNRQDVSAHAWGAVSFDRPGAPATLALYGDPANARGPATFFSMRTPFAYLSATQGLDKEPLVYRSGESFELKYLVVVTDRVLTPEAVAKRGQAAR